MNWISSIRFFLILCLISFFFTACRKKSAPKKVLTKEQVKQRVIEKITTDKEWDVSREEFIPFSGKASPDVSLAVERNDNQLRVCIEVKAFQSGGQTPEINLGIAGDKNYIIKGEASKKKYSGDVSRYFFIIPAVKLFSVGESDWKKLRLAFDVTWPGGFQGKALQKEQFLQVGNRSPHAGLSSEVSDWSLFNLQDHEQLIRDRKDKIAFEVTQPMNGVLSVVIEDNEGKRVRNLISGVDKTKGNHLIEWDGLDEYGNLVKPGKYSWRGISHPGIKAEYQMSFDNGGEKFFFPFGSNHSMFLSATANSKYLFLGAPLTEGGWSLVALDYDGNWKHGYRQINGTGITGIAIAADDKYLYTAHDGPGWCVRVDKSKKEWVVNQNITLAKYNIENERSVDFPKRRHFVKLENYQFGPGAKNKSTRKQISLGGMALLNGSLYISSRAQNALLVVNPETGEIRKKINLESPGPIASAHGKLYVFSGKKLFMVDYRKALGGIKKTSGNSASGRTSKPLTEKRVQAKLLFKKKSLIPEGLTIGPKRRIYVSDGKSNTIKIFTNKGKLKSHLGIPGGAYQGKYIKERMVAPRGLTFAGKRLWVTENRRNPKRIFAWDVKKKKVVIAKFGNPPYGGSGAGGNRNNMHQWIGQRCLWNIDIKKKTAECASILSKGSGHVGGLIPWCFNYHFLKVAGRQFTIGMFKTSIISELLPEGSMKDLALFSTAHLFLYAMNWKIPDAFRKAFTKKYPQADFDKKLSKYRNVGILWVDKNGDGLFQENEFEIGPENIEFSNGAFWGHGFHDLTMKIAARVDNKKDIIVTLKPNVFLASGAPAYPTLKKGIADAVPIKTEALRLDRWKRINPPSTVDRFGNLLMLTSPFMSSYSPNGKLNWLYPNKWSGVHGSHKAPLPETGVIQGALFFLGTAPLDDKSDVFVVNGNHGRFFVMTSDGIYLDELFNDCRTVYRKDDQYIGGEPFGGFFDRETSTGKYYLLTGASGYRIYQLNGLDKIKRSAGSITVTKEQLMAAERRLSKQEALVNTEKEAIVKILNNQTVKIDGNDNDIKVPYTIKWDKSGRMSVKVKITCDSRDLYLVYNVVDPSPWVNNGKDWTLLFKTGDSVDLQIATTTTRRKDPSKPITGDIRLLIAPYGNKNIAVLYRYRLKNKKGASPVTFTSPWRSETVDDVSQLKNAKIAVHKDNGWYRVEAAIPLVDLGLKPSAGKKFKADLGVIYGDADGTVNLLRSYWSNQSTGLVNDVPGEIMLFPDRWGTLKFEK